MRVGWLADQPTSPGGAELTQAEFRQAAPDTVEIVDCPPGRVLGGLDCYILHNIVSYPLTDLQALSHRRVIKYNHDVGPWLQPEVVKWLRRHAVQVCCSPIQADHMGVAAQLIPPPVDLDRFERAAEQANGSRSGAVSVGSWRNYGKAPHKAAEWGRENGGIDFFGAGPLAPPGSVDVPYDAMPGLLAQYETFVFLPVVLEPFGRLVAEAWAAGCEIVTNQLVGAAWWIRENPDAIRTASMDLWRLVTG